MMALKNADTGTWHLLGARGCGARPRGGHSAGAYSS